MSRRLSFVLGTSLLGACPADPQPNPDSWEIVHEGLPGALLSVWGANASDVWTVGGDTLDGLGPTVLHFDGETWTRMETGQTQGNLWWVYGFEDGPVFMGGDGGVILRYEDGQFTQMDTPGNETVFGLWGSTPQDMWAVGGASASAGGFAWRREGDAWVQEATLPAEVAGIGAVWKVFGLAADDAWFVGSNGIALHWDGNTLETRDTGVGSSLFTVHANADRYVAVGGSATGIITQYVDGQWSNVTAEPPPPGLSGVALSEGDFGIAVGSFGAVYARSADGWAREDTGFNLPFTLHGAWIDEEGGAWAVGGQVLTPPYNDGLLLHYGASIPSDGL